MSILDTTVVNVAIDHLAIVFHSSLTTIQSVITGYTLALAAVIPVTGWAADRFGTKRIYMWSLVLFTLGSILSGLAWSAGSLISQIISHTAAADAWATWPGTWGGTPPPSGDDRHVAFDTHVANPAVSW
jgi:MFS family permease